MQSFQGEKFILVGPASPNQSKKSITFFNLEDVYRHVKAIGECIILYPNCTCFFNHASFSQC